MNQNTNRPISCKKKLLCINYSSKIFGPKKIISTSISHYLNRHLTTKSPLWRRTTGHTVKSTMAAAKRPPPTLLHAADFVHRSRLQHKTRLRRDHYSISILPPPPVHIEVKMLLPKNARSEAGSGFHLCVGFSSLAVSAFDNFSHFLPR